MSEATEEPRLELSGDEVRLLHQLLNNAVRGGWAWETHTVTGFTVDEAGQLLDRVERLPGVWGDNE